MQDCTASSLQASLQALDATFASYTGDISCSLRQPATSGGCNSHRSLDDAVTGGLLLARMDGHTDEPQHQLGLQLYNVQQSCEDEP